MSSYSLKGKVPGSPDIHPFLKTNIEFARKGLGKLVATRPSSTTLLTMASGSMSPKDTCVNHLVASGRKNSCVKTGGAGIRGSKQVGACGLVYSAAAGKVRSSWLLPFLVKKRVPLLSPPLPVLPERTLESPIITPLRQVIASLLYPLMTSRPCISK